MNEETIGECYSPGEQLNNERRSLLFSCLDKAKDVLDVIAVVSQRQLRRDNQTHENPRYRCKNAILAFRGRLGDLQRLVIS